MAADIGEQYVEQFAESVGLESDGRNRYTDAGGRLVLAGNAVQLTVYASGEVTVQGEVVGVDLEAENPLLYLAGERHGWSDEGAITHVGTFAVSFDGRIYVDGPVPEPIELST